MGVDALRASDATVQPSASSSDHDDEQWETRLDVKPELEAPDTLRSMMVIVVDDDPDCRNMMASVLELYGAHVLTAPGAKLALNLLAQHGADAIVTDLMMPGEDGYWLLHQARTIGGQTAALICVSGVASSTRDVLGAGFDRFLRKPIDPDELARLLAETLRLRRDREVPQRLLHATVPGTASEEPGQLQREG